MNSQVEYMNFGPSDLFSGLTQVIVIVTAVFWSISCYAANSEQLEALNGLSPYFDVQKSPSGLSVSSRDSCPVKIVKLAVLYKHRPEQYRNDFFGMLVIDDYADRDKGIYNFVDGDQVGPLAGESVKKFGKPADARFEPVIAYCSFRDKNLWVNTAQRGRISLARFMRGVFLSALLKNTSEDPLAIANAVDRHTAQQYERESK